jgi:hypothetical protein
MNRKKCLIISLKYHAGHWSHVVATYSLFTDLGYDTYLFVNEQFFTDKFKTDYRVCEKLKLIDYRIFDTVIVLFPHLKNTRQFLRFKLLGRARLIYFFHEPISSYRSFYNSGFSIGQILRLFFVNQFNKLTTFIATVIILPSETSFLTYKRDYEYLNVNYFKAPLLFDDEFKGTELNISEKKYISYIGTIASDHAFINFCEFVIYAINNELFRNMEFLIATNSLVDAELKKVLLSLGADVNIKIIDGSWLSDDEINYFYRTSAVVWNAYDRSNQSGVLAKSFMFATPVLGNNLIPNEFIIQNANGVYLKNNSDLYEMSTAIFHILNNLDSYALRSRETFIKNFYYKNQVDFFRNIV